jgi:peptidoglycan/xylan/chitin deacetylase (PgdA/CDA1 family)
VFAFPVTAAAADGTAVLSAPSMPWVLREGHVVTANTWVGPAGVVSAGDTATAEIDRKAADGTWARDIPLKVTLLTGRTRVWVRFALPGRAYWRARVSLAGAEGRHDATSSVWASLRTVSHNYVVLTFDDGPRPGSTKPIVDTLARNGIRGEFFMLGSQVRAYPYLARYVVDKGMRAQNHSTTHANLARLSRTAVLGEIDGCTRQIFSATSTRPGWLRPPYGNTNRTVSGAAVSRGMHVVLWSVDPMDWRRPSAVTIASRVISATRPGSVVLMHDGGGDRSRTVAAVPTIISALRKARYDFVTLNEWRALGAQPR